MTGPAMRLGRPGTALVLVLAATLSALAVCGCAGSEVRTGTSGAAATAADSPTASSRTAAGPGTLNPTDLAWLQLQLAMDEQALRILELAPGSGAAPELKQWAAKVAKGHRADLTALRKLLTATGVPDSDPHEGHDMPGMVNATELRALEAAEGEEFDRLLRSALRDHLTHTERLSGEQQKAGSDPKVKQRAASIGQSASDHLRRMPQ
ncbi:DUF305 domain-containing protein [Streptomyces milbemycinicus]|uniref:DUF305 domain-containing protein n=1 Tax=Streptomyces milbemycinicus TaxID=476552 RepID=A0ABW8LDW6_9ACTN